VTRLLSPNRRRIWPNKRSIDSELSTTEAALKRLGWLPYSGPAEVDARGWIVPGSDPLVIPLPLRQLPPDDRPIRLPGGGAPHGPS
jgi:hypothetical protein